MTDAARPASRRLVVIDDEDGRRRLVQLLDGDPNFTLVGECPHADAVAVVHQVQPDVALIGLDRELHALELFAPIRAQTPGCRLVAHSDLVDPWTLGDVLGRGGHLLIDVATDLAMLPGMLDQVDDSVDLGEEAGQRLDSTDSPHPLLGVVDEDGAIRVAHPHRHPKLRSWFQASMAAVALVAAALGVARVTGMASVPAERAYQHVLIGS